MRWRKPTFLNAQSPGTSSRQKPKPIVIQNQTYRHPEPNLSSPEAKPIVILNQAYRHPELVSG
jgi:hypothetical protein